MESAYLFGVGILQNRIINSNDAVMFDIDDTLIRTGGTPIEHMIDLAREAKELDYKVILMTARPAFKENIEWTLDQLKQLNIPYSMLYFCPPETKGELKLKLGLNFILSVGDLDTDLTNTDHWINTSSGYYN
jgi:ribonucleotide monophosphatase NagD (HAD superfamily)